MRPACGFALVALLLAPLPAAATSPAYIVVDADAGTVLAESDSGRRWFPASVTKLMTAYVTFGALKAGSIKLASPVTVSANALAEPPSKMGFKVGTVMNLDNALKMMLVHSANDIAVAVGETVSGSEAGFVAAMNAAARALGMTATRYRNPNGLPDDGQVTTARDLAVLARAIWVEFPEYREYFRIPAIKAGRRTLRSQNLLLERYRGANGMKTGFTCGSGFNIVASATRSGRTLIAVVLGADSSNDRAETAARLLNKGFVGGFTGFGAKDLASYRGTASGGAPANLSDEVCKRRKKAVDEDSMASSALGPPFAVMPPVVVTTGLADRGASVKASATPTPAPGTASKGPSAKGIPLPRLRPPYPAGADAGEISFGQRFDPGIGDGTAGPAELVR